MAPETSLDDVLGVHGPLGVSVFSDSGVGVWVGPFSGLVEIYFLKAMNSILNNLL